MADIIDFHQEVLGSDATEAENNDTFLLEEGLDLLASYRTIRDADVRRSILHLVRTLSLTNGNPKQ